MREYRITVEESHPRVDVFLAGRAELGLSRSRIRALIDEGYVTLNGSVPKPGQAVNPGDVIVVQVPDPEPVQLVPEPIPLDIVYEDEDVVVVNKPRGLVVHPAAGHWTGTLVHALLEKVDDLEGIGGKLRPGIVHRLDKDTTGLLVVAKSERAMASLQEQIREHLVQRVYWALVHGNNMPDTGRIEAPIGRHPRDRKRMAVNARTGRDAVTYFRVLERYRGYALLECRLETGRTHQIRVHLSFIGHPVVGDPLYGPRKPALGMPPQALHARQLCFRHPATGEWMEFTVDPPADMMAVIQRLREEA